MAAVIASGWVMQGPRVAEFERTVAEFCGATHAVACSSGTTALHLALLSLGIGPGDEVIVPSLSFIATANAVIHCGATPMFAEVDEETLNLDPGAAEAAISPRTKAIMPVHQIGLPADIDAFCEIGHRRGLAIVEDAACALGSKYKGRLLGSHSPLVCLSFHPRKVITTGEGGMILTANERLAKRMRQLREHGLGANKRYEEVGYNFRLTDLQAAMGIVQMSRLNEILERRRRLAARYTVALAKTTVRPLTVPAWAEPNFQSYAVQLAKKASLTRDALVARLNDQGIAAGFGIAPIHSEPAYAQRVASLSLPHTERASETTLLLPLFPSLTDAEQDSVIDAVRRATAA